MGRSGRGRREIIYTRQRKTYVHNLQSDGRGGGHDKVLDKHHGTYYKKHVQQHGLERCSKGHVNPTMSTESPWSLVQGAALESPHFKHANTGSQRGGRGRSRVRLYAEGTGGGWDFEVGTSIYVPRRRKPKTNTPFSKRFLGCYLGFALRARAGSFGSRTLRPTRRKIKAHAKTSRRSRLADGQVGDGA